MGLAVRSLLYKRPLVSLPAGEHLLQNIKDASLHVIECVFASSSSNRKNQL